MVVPITALYAGLLALLAIALGMGSGFIRARTGVSLGEGGGANAEQLVAFRRHGNFAEWVPLALILLAILELNSASSTALHAMGIGLVAARVCHPLGLKADDSTPILRTIGAAGTALVVLVAGIWALTTAL